MSEINLLFWMSLLTLAVVMIYIYSRWHQEAVRETLALRKAEQMYRQSIDDSDQRIRPTVTDASKEPDRGIRFYTVAQLETQQSHPVLSYQLPRLMTAYSENRESLVSNCQHDCA